MRVLFLLLDICSSTCSYPANSKLFLENALHRILHSHLSWEWLRLEEVHQWLVYALLNLSHKASCYSRNTLLMIQRVKKIHTLSFIFSYVSYLCRIALYDQLQYTVHRIVTEGTNLITVTPTHIIIDEYSSYTHTRYANSTNVYVLYIYIHIIAEISLTRYIAIDLFLISIDSIANASRKRRC